MELPNVDGIVADIPDPAAPGTAPAVPGAAPATPPLKPMFGYCDEFEKAYPKKK